jgi:thiosulfate/3-mercaptopyruvate sulfurtransferase
MNRSTLVSAQQLRECDPREVLIVDCRFELSDVERGARDYANAHIPGAVYADLNRDLSDLSKTGVGRHPLPDADQVSKVLGAWSWHPETFVVAYDDAGGALAAARLWWMLRLVGSRRVAVLDGGISAWTKAGFELDANVPSRGRSPTDVAFDESQIVMTDELQRLSATPQTLLLDARGAPRYRGEVEPIDRVAGHVPGARNRPFSDNLDANRQFKQAAQLRSEFDAIRGSHAPRDVIHMCGSGVTACHNLLAMEHAGLHGSRVYAPSWSGWIADSNRAIAVGEN